MCDGSVKFLDEKTDLQIMQALATPAGGEPYLGSIKDSPAVWSEND